MKEELVGGTGKASERIQCSTLLRMATSVLFILCLLSPLSAFERMGRGVTGVQSKWEQNETVRQKLETRIRHLGQHLCLFGENTAHVLLIKVKTGKQFPLHSSDFMFVTFGNIHFWG